MFFEGFFFSCVLFGTQKGAQRGTLDAMSRRKLGSRPQHLSAIQGKPEGAAMCGHAETVGDGCDDGGFFLGETKINSSHSFCFIASLRMDWMRAGHQLPNNGSLLF